MKETYSIMIENVKDYRARKFLPPYNVFVKVYDMKWYGNGYPSEKLFKVYYYILTNQPNLPVESEKWGREWYSIYDGNKAVCEHICCSREEIDTKVRQDIRKYMDNFV